VTRLWAQIKEPNPIPGWGTQVPTQPPVQQASSREAKWPALVADYSLLSSAKVMSVRRYTSTPMRLCRNA
jgi:hypothetical protein